MAMRSRSVSVGAMALVFLAVACGDGPMVSDSDAPAVGVGELPELDGLVLVESNEGDAVEPPATAVAPPPESDVVVTTAPPDGEGVCSEDCLEGWRFAVRSFAEEYGASEEVAEQMLEAQGYLADYADKVRREPGYAGFEPPEVRGVLAVVPESTISPPDHLRVPVVLVHARLEEQDLLRFNEELTEGFVEIGVEDIVGVTYDPFEDEVIIWMSPTAESWPTRAEAEAVILDRQGARFEGVGVRFQRAAGFETGAGFATTAPPLSPKD